MKQLQINHNVVKRDIKITQEKAKLEVQANSTDEVP